RIPPPTRDPQVPRAPHAPARPTPSGAMSPDPPVQARRSSGAPVPHQRDPLLPARCCLTLPCRPAAGAAGPSRTSETHSFTSTSTSTRTRDVLVLVHVTRTRPIDPAPERSP